MTWCCRPRDGRHQNHARGLCSRVKSSGGQARGSGCNEQGSANAQLSSQHPEPVPPCSRSFVHYLTGGRSGKPWLLRQKKHPGCPAPDTARGRGASVLRRLMEALIRHISRSCCWEIWSLALRAWGGGIRGRLSGCRPVGPFRFRAGITRRNKDRIMVKY